MLPRQRIVLVVALGFALLVLAGTINRVWVGTFSGAGGWFSYAPNTGAIYSPDADPYTTAYREAAVYLVAAALWAGISVWLLRDRSPGASED